VIEYLLDTNIVIYTMRDRPPEIRTRFTRNYGLMAISTVTLMELYYGSENSDDPRENRSIIEGFVARLELLHTTRRPRFTPGSSGKS
jgi:tRNA(fMet)-specific endonuclease VapC